MLLIEKVDIDREKLASTARWYGLEREITAMYRPLQGEFTISEEVPVALPSETEFIALKEQYGVS